MKIRGTIKKNKEEKYSIQTQLSPHLEEYENVPIEDILEEFEDKTVEISIFPSLSPGEYQRGIVRIKPIQIGLHHYTDVHGSVCSADVEGTPKFERPTLISQDFQIAARAAKYRKYDFIEMEPPLTVYDQNDMLRIPEVISLDTDAILFGKAGCNPLEKFTVEQIGLPMLTGNEPEAILYGLRAKKFLKESKFLYIGEIPSFSAPEGPWDFFKVQKRFGTKFRHIETNEFYRNYDKFSDEEVKKELERWKQDFDKIEPPQEEMMNATRAYLALKFLAGREGANGITVNCGRFTEERPVVPCLAFARLIDEGIICSCEGDITAMLSSFMLHGITGQPILMGNFGSKKGRFEAGENEVTIEHDIIPLSMAKEKFTIRDYHGRNFGVTAYADIEEKPMTLLNLNTNLDTISIIEGKIKHSMDGIHCRVIVHMEIDGDISKVPDIIVGSQHMSMIFGHWQEELEAMADQLSLSINTLK